jgi:hypothetical protein
MSLYLRFLYSPSEGQGNDLFCLAFLTFATPISLVPFETGCQLLCNFNSHTLPPSSSEGLNGAVTPRRSTSDTAALLSCGLCPVLEHRNSDAPQLEKRCLRFRYICGSRAAICGTTHTVLGKDTFSLLLGNAEMSLLEMMVKTLHMCGR